MNSLVSIIIPTYNENVYIEECINSLINQTYKHIEIILVDDGSKEDIANYYDKIAKIDVRIKVHHIKNGGVSCARNYGISNSNGEYIVFADADDFYKTDAIERLINNSREVDLVIENYTRSETEFIEDDCNLVTHIFPNYEVISYSLNFSEAVGKGLVSKVKSSYFNSIWAKLYKRRIIEDNDIKFNQECKYGEDLLFNLDYLKSINNVRLANEIIYFYRKNEKSATHKFALSDLESVLKQVECMKMICHEEKTYYILLNLINIFVCSVETKDTIIINRALDYIQQNSNLFNNSKVRFRGLQGIVYSCVLILWKLNLYSISKMVVRVYLEVKKI